MEALCLRMYFERLFESSQKHTGERHFDGAPGVYLHKNDTSKKAEYFMLFSHLAKGTPLHVVAWEVATLRPHKMKVKRYTDQWVQPGESVKLVPLWVCIRDL